MRRFVKVSCQIAYMVDIDSNSILTETTHLHHLFHLDMCVFFHNTAPPKKVVYDLIVGYYE